MKQIPFTLEAFGPDGLLKDGYEVKTIHGLRIDFIKVYGDYISIVTSEGTAYSNLKSGTFKINMYRRTRTAEEVAREKYNIIYDPNIEFDSLWDRHNIIALVQAGMDEMTK